MALFDEVDTTRFNLIFAAQTLFRNR